MLITLGNFEVIRKRRFINNNGKYIWNVLQAMRLKNIFNNY